MEDIFAGWAVIAGAKGIERIANSIHVIEKLAENAAPSFRARQRVVGDEIEPARNASLQMNCKRVVARAIVGAKDGDVGDVIALVGHVLGVERRKEREAGLILIAAVSVVALFVSVIGGESPVGVESVLEASSGVKRVRSFVMRINDRAGAGNVTDRTDGGRGWQAS